MSRKHFIEMAAQLHASRPSSSVIGLTTAKVDALNAAHAQWEKDVDVIADICAASNPRFDRERFVAACEGE